jgi:16S rRNA (cytosine1402-N4)-methyltransferase
MTRARWRSSESEVAGGDAPAEHVPVLVAETLAALAPARGGVFVDCTVGLGGHTRALLEAGADRVIAFDRDADALQLAQTRLGPLASRAVFIHADYREAVGRLAALGIEAVAGWLADLGLSSMQLEAPGRGFSFRRDDPLDMRMDRSQGPTVAERLQAAREEEIADAIFTFGEERYSRRIARALVAARQQAPIETTRRLAEIVRRAVPHRGHQRIDPATRTFQALRIWVNRELDGLDTFVRDGVGLLSPGGRTAVICFHSLEDRIVKHTLRDLERSGRVRLLQRKPVVPGAAEIDRNPRARSAKLRAAERLP